MSIELQALLVWLGNYGYLSYEKQQEFLWELGGIKIGTGTLQKTNERVAAVVKRKVSGGSRSMSRFEQTADLRFVIQTYRFQSRSAISFFREALSAHSCDFLMPSLIPTSQT